MVGLLGFRVRNGNDEGEINMPNDAIRNLVIGLICLFLLLFVIIFPLVGHRIGVWYSKSWAQLDETAKKKLTTRRFILGGISLLVGGLSLIGGWVNKWPALMFLGFMVGGVVLPIFSMLIEYYTIYMKIKSEPPLK